MYIEEQRECHTLILVYWNSASDCDFAAFYGYDPVLDDVRGGCLWNGELCKYLRKERRRHTGRKKRRRPSYEPCSEQFVHLVSCFRDCCGFLGRARGKRGHCGRKFGVHSLAGGGMEGGR